MTDLTNPSKDSFSDERTNAVPFTEALRVWMRIAALSFGGPAGQIAVMHRILVEEKRWIGERRFLHALNYCMLLPGPEAHQLSVYIGWLLNRTWGGIVAGTLFVMPGLVALGILSWIYAVYGEVGLVQGVFFGLKAAVLAVVLEAVQRVGKRALKGAAAYAIAAAAFVGIFFFAVPFPLIVATAALIGYAGGRIDAKLFSAGGHGKASGKTDDSEGVIDRLFAQGTPEHVRPSLARAIKIAIIGAVLWLGPLLVVFIWLGPANVFTAIAAFNSKMAVVTFGGAYAVLAYMTQQAVENYGWLQPGEMLVGLGFAETTPGPLISVVEFVGFMAAFRDPGPLDPLLAGALGGLLAMWSTFVPSFLWIFLGAPYVEALLGNRALTSALSAVTAAVVGVILNLAVWFALHVLFGQVKEFALGPMRLFVPVWETIDVAALILSAAAMIAIFRLKIGMLYVLAGSSLAGLLLSLVFATN